MRVVAIVPIKFNNERLPNKNLKSFKNGKPLIYYILETLLSIDILDEVYVYCSDEKICNYIPSKVKYIKRNEKLDTSETKMNEILLEFSKKIYADVYVLSHATSPFIKKQNIEVGIKSVLYDKYDSALSVQRVQDFLWKDNKPLNYDPCNISRTQDLELLYSETTGFYVFKRELIVNKNRRVGDNPYFVEVSKIESIDIDEPEDFNIADAIYNFLLKKEDENNV